MKSYWRLFPAYLLVAFFCSDLERDNILDPKNPNSKADQIVLVELFVNDNTGYNYCETALEAIEALSEDDNYRNKILVLEYHIEKNDLADSFSLPECYDRYASYVPVQADRGIPDAFFNGKLQRVQGASVEMVKDRYQTALSEVSDRKSFFRCEAEKTVNGTVVTINTKIIRLGVRSQKNVNISVVLVEDLGMPQQRFVVRKILPSQVMDIINPGEVRSFAFSGTLSGIRNFNNAKAIVFIQNRNEATMEIYQAAQF